MAVNDFYLNSNPDICINMSDKNIPVYEDLFLTGGQKNAQIGTIYPREAFSSTYGDGYTVICFRNKSGIFTLGYLPDVDENYDPILDDETWRKAFTYCTDYPYGTVYIEGKKYYTFKFRRSEEVYTAAGNRWGTVASNMRIACLSSLAGATHPDWKSVNYVERSTDGAWVKVEGDGYSYGFVDAGFNNGSTPTSISMYGTW